MATEKSQKELTANQEEKKNKKKGIIIGILGATASILTVAIPVGINSLSNKEKSYTVTFSTDDVKDFEDYEKVVKEGTTVGKLKDLITPIEGYDIEGFYKDQDCTDPFDDNDVIDKDTKVYIKYVVKKFTITFYDNFDKTTNPKKMGEMVIDYFGEIYSGDFPDVNNYGSSEEGYAEYLFDGWVDASGKRINFSAIREDMDAYTSYISRVNEYEIINYHTENVEITNLKEVGSNKLTYGQSIHIKVTPTEGYYISNLTIYGVELDTSKEYKTYETSDGRVFVIEGDYIVTGNVIVDHYHEEKIMLEATEVSSNVVLKILDNEGKETGAVIEQGQEVPYGTRFKIVYTTTPGKQYTGCEISNLTVIDTIDGSEVYVVTKDFSVIYNEEWIEYTLTFDSNKVSIKDSLNRDLVSGESILHYGDKITITYHLTDDTGYKMTKFVVTGADGELVNGGVFTVTGDVKVEFEETKNTYKITYFNENGEKIGEISVKWNEDAVFAEPTKESTKVYNYEFLGWFTEQNGETEATLTNIKENMSVYAKFKEVYIEYTLAFSEGVTIKNSNGNDLASGVSTLHYGDIITITYDETEGYKSELTFSGLERIGETDEYRVTGNVVVALDDYIITFEIGEIDSCISIYLGEEVTGTKLKKGQKVEYGSKITIHYELDEGYHFGSLTINGQSYNKDQNNITIELKTELTITFVQEINTYTVTFYDETGKKIDDVIVDWNSSAKHAVPTKASTEMYVYKFLGWYTELDGNTQANLSNIKSDMSVYAKFEESLREYTIRFNSHIEVTDEDGNDLTSGVSKLHYGDKIIITYHLTDDTGYKVTKFTVTGADGELVSGGTFTVTGDVQIDFAEAKNTYTVTYYDDAGNKLGEVSVKWDENANISNPTKKSDSTYSYTFVGWYTSLDFDTEATLTNIKENKSIYAKFKESYIEYTLTFNDRVTIKNSNGQALTSGVSTLHYGDIITITYVETDMEGYKSELAISGLTRIGDTNEYKVTGNVSAIVRDNIITYVIGTIPKGISIYLGDEATGTILKQGQKIEYGSKITIHYELNEGYHFGSLTINGQGYSKERNDITIELKSELTINFVQEINTYTVTFYDETGKKIDDVTVNWNSSARHAVPTKASTELYNYVFLGWFTELDGDTEATLTNIKGDMSVYARFKSVLREYALTFGAGVTVTDEDGNELTSGASTLHYGDKIIITYHFTNDEGYELAKFAVTGASGELVNGGTFTITGDVKIEFTETKRTYIITYYDDTGKKLGEASVKWAEDAKISNPSKSSNSTYTYTFVGWYTSLDFDTEATLTDIRENKSIYAKFESVYREYTLTFDSNTVLIKDADGKILVSGVDTVHYGDKITIEEIVLIGDWVNAIASRSGVTLVSGTTYSITGNVSITTNVGHKYLSLTLSGNEYIVYGLKSNVSVTEVVIPATHFDGRPITSIYGGTRESNGAFYNKTITSIEIGENIKSIGNYAFYGCTNLTKIVWNAANVADFAASNYVFYNAGKSGTGIQVIFGETAESVPAYCFYPYSSSSYSPKITSVTIGDNVTSIGNNAFYYCTNMTSVIIGNGVTKIGTYAFYYCSSLSSVQVGESVTSIGTYAFSGCSVIKDVNFTGPVDSWASISFADTYSNPCYYSKSLKINGVLVSEVTINVDVSNYAFYNVQNLQRITFGNNASSIGNSAFYSCTGLTSITFSDSVSSIGTYAFYNCTALPSVIIGNGVKSIGNYAFSVCTSLTSVVIGNNVETIGSCAFYNCSKLSSATIGSSVKTIGNDAFYNCSKLTEVNFTGSADDWASIDFGNYNSNPCYYAKSLKMGGVLISEATVSVNIGKYAFYNVQNLQRITLGEDVTSIGTDAFNNCTGLTYVNFTGSVEDWASISFANSVANPCYYAKSLRIDGVLISEAALNVNVSAYAFYNVQNLKKVTFGNDITSIGTYAFCGCSGLAGELVIPNNVISVETYAFRECSSLTSVTLGDGLTKVADYVFYNCSKITSISFGENITSIGYYTFYGCSSLKTLTIPSTVTTIGSYAFRECTSLSSVIISGSVTNIGSNAFYNCTAIKDVNFLGTVEDWASISFSDTYSNPTYYSKSLKIDGVLISDVTINVDINDYVFYNVQNLKNVTLGENVTSIGYSSFYGCTGLTTVDFNKNISKLGANAFRDCSSLTSTIVLKNITSIGAYTFYNCSKLTSVTFGDLTSIGEYAFNGCSSLTAANFGAEATSIGNYAFYNCSKLTSALDLSKTTSVGEYAFYGCSGLTSINLNPNVSTIGKYAFYNCSNWSAEIALNNLSTINEYAFYGCGNLKSVIIGNKVTTISQYAFYNCSKITSLTLGDALRTISTYAFYGCRGLTTVTIPSTVTSYGNYAFQNCYRLAEVINLTSYTFTPGNTSYGYVAYYANVVHSDSESRLQIIDGVYYYDDGTDFIAVGPTDINVTSVNLSARTTKIRQYAFYYCSALTEIVIPESVTSIGTYAFHSCSTLTSITWNAINVKDFSSSNYIFYNAGKDGDGIEIVFGENVESIPAYCFYPYSSTSYTPKIKSVTIGESVTRIGTYAFAYCNTLKTIEIPNNVTSIGDYAFYQCTGLTSATLSENITTIGNYVFYYCTSLDNVVIPEKVTSIGNYAFYNCTSIRGLVIPENVESIGERAFYGCTLLSSVTLKEGLTSIASYAFYNCKALQSFTIPVSVISIGSNAFDGCSGLTEVNYMGTAEQWASITFANSTANPCYYSKSLKFGGKLLNEITINVNINDYAFYNVLNINSVTLGKNVTSIGTNAFYGCTGISELNFTGTLKDWTSITFANSTANPTYYSKSLSIDGVQILGELRISCDVNAYAFYNVIGITSLIFEGDCSNIGSSSFYGCTGLTTIDFDDNVSTIEGSAFYGCTVLTKVNFGDNVSSIGASAFYGCTKLSTVNFGENVSTIGSSAFYNCSIKSITIPESVTSIGSSAFYGNNTSSVYYLGTVNQWASISFGGGTANPCYYSKSLYIQGVRLSGTLALDVSVKAYTFYNITGISSLTFGENVTSIGSYAFYGCTGLISLTTGDNIISIGSYAFSGCTGMTSVVIGDSVTSIGTYAFQSCNKLSSVTIGKNVQSIESSAFTSCSAISSVDFKGTVDDWASITFGGGTANPCYYSKSLKINGEIISEVTINVNVKAYAFYYVQSLKKVTLGSSVTTIATYAFYNCTEMTSVSIVGNVTSIGTYAFAYCKGLTTITIPSSMTTISDNAFNNCNRLVEVINLSTKIKLTIGDTKNGYVAYYAEVVKTSGESTLQEIDGVYYLEKGNDFIAIAPVSLDCTSIKLSDKTTKIRDYAFYNCSKLTSVKMGEGVTAIGTYAFSGCSSLKEISIPNSTTSIETYAFSGCSNMTSVTIGINIKSIGTYAFNNCSNLQEVNFLGTVDNWASISFGDTYSNPCYYAKSLKLNGVLVSEITINVNVNAYAFYNVKNIKNLDISENVTSIGTYAFYGCSNISSHLLLSNVTSIGTYAFYGCEKLQAVTFSTKLTNIPAYAFYNCNGMIRITIPASVNSIDSYAFQNCYRLAEVVNLSKLSITSGTTGNGYVAYYAETVHSGTESRLQIIDGVYYFEDGDDFIAIGPVDINCTRLTIAERTTKIRTYAFYNCTNLTEIIWNAANVADFASSNYIFAYAGQEGDGITVTFGETVESIPAYCFYPYSTTSYAPKIINVIIGDGAKSIGTYAFRACSSLVSVIIGNSVESIGTYAFYGCSNLESVTIGESVTSIGNYAFYNCTKLTQINWNAINVKDFSSNNYVFYYAGQNGNGIEVVYGEKVEYIPSNAFYPYNSSSYVPKIKSVVIGNSVKSIGSNAFYYCSSLVSVTIGNGVTSIGASAFYYCSSLASVTIGNSVTSIGVNAFYYCSAIKEVNFIGSVSDWASISFGGSTANPCYYSNSLKINGVLISEAEINVDISAYAFYNVKNLERVTIGEDVTSIGVYAFYNSINLTKITWNAINVSDFASSNYVFYCSGQSGDGIEVIFGDKVERIPAYCFYPSTTTSYTPKIKSVTIGESVKNIGTYAFYYSRDLEQINWNAVAVSNFTGGTSSSSSHNNIFAYAGQNGDGVAVIFGDKVENIPSYCFAPNASNPSTYTPKITSIVIGESVKSIGIYAFYYSRDLEQITWNAANVSTFNSSNCIFYNAGTNGNGVAVTFGKTVQSIPAYCFYPASSNTLKITSVTISESVTSIGNYAFENCSKLQDVNFTGTIDDWASISFGNSTSNPIYYTHSLKINGEFITEATINVNVKAYAFNYFTNLTRVTIGEDVTSIGNNAFIECFRLAEVINLSNLNLYAGSTSYGYVAYYANSVHAEGDIGLQEIDGVYYIENETEFIAIAPVDYNCTSIKLSDKTTKIKDYAFYNCSNLVEITLPESLTNIGSYSFSGCSSLTTVILGNNIKSIGSYAFSNCNALTSVAIGDNVTSIGSYAFSGCSGLISATIGNNIKTINTYTFNNCSSLRFVTIGENVTSIGNNAFTGCSNLQEVNFLGTVNQWASISFGNSESNPCYHSKSLKIDGELIAEATINVNVSAYAFYNVQNLIEITIGENVTSIGTYAFYGCSSLAEITIPANVTSLGTHAFYNCNGLQKVNFLGTIDQWARISFGNEYANPCYYSKTLYINGELLTDVTISVNANSYSFYNVTNLTSIIFDENVTSIGSHAFRGCNGLTSITIGNSVTSIATYAFYGCSGLTSVAIGDNVTSIGSYAFYGCSVLTSVAIGDNVTSIGSYAFYDCSGLTSVTIGSGVTTINSYAFNNCSSLQEVNFLGTVDQWASISFGDSTANPCYYSKALKINGILVSELSINVNVKAYAFYYVNNIERVIIGENVTSIGSNAFYYCYKLIEVVNLSQLSITAGSTANGYVAYYAEIVHNDTESRLKVIDGVYYMESDDELIAIAPVNSDCTSIKLSDKTTQIRKYAFYGCRNLVEIIIPASVNSIGTYAFYGCSSLTSVTIPASVNSIESYTFYNCSSLSSITIPENVTSIGNYAFYGCTKLITINWNAINVKNLGSSNYVFYNAGQDGEGIEVIFGNKVESIPAYCFYPYSSYSPKITSVVIGEGVTSIGTYAFYNCKDITQITWNAVSVQDFSSNNYVFYSAGQNSDGIEVIFGDKVESIPAYCFYPYSTSSAPTIKVVTIGENVTSIGTYAFAYCTNLSKVIIGKNVNNIGDSAFISCYKLAEIFNLSSLDIIAGSTSHGYVAYYTDIVYTDTESQLQEIDGVYYLKIGDEFIAIAPVDNNCTSIKLSDKTTRIRKYAFYNCSSLSSITIPASVQSIGGYAFYGCTKLQELTIQGNVTSIENYTFYNCTSLSSITIPESIVNIGNYAFYNCNSLTSITIGENVTSIGNYAFYGCTKLTTINWNAISIQDFSSSNYVFYNAGQDGDGIELIFGDKVQNIPAFCFYPYGSSYYPKITSVTIGENVTSIGNYAFGYCKNLTSITIPEKVTSIGNYAFYNCSGLTSVIIEDGVISIGDDAFSGCSSLTSITIPTSVTSLGTYVFYNCSGLTSVTIGKGVTSIGSNSFSGCSSLTSITISSNVTSFGSYAFNGCSALQKVDFLGTADQWASIKFYDTTANPCYYSKALYIDGELLTDVTISVNVNIYAFYNVANLTNIQFDENVTSIEGYAFYGCSGLNSVTIGNGITSIGTYAFYGCSSLTSVTIGESVKSIGTYAFYKCIELSSVTIGTSVTSIGNYAFYGCRSLAKIIWNAVNVTDFSVDNCIFYEAGQDGDGIEIVFGNNVQSIPANCFDPYGLAISSPKIVSVVIGKNVTSIGNYAFYNCNEIDTIYYGGTEVEWNLITIGTNNTRLTSTSSKIYYFSESPNYDGSHWHFDEETGEPIVWVQKDE